MKVKDFKVGVLYCKEGQISEREIFDNGIFPLSPSLPLPNATTNAEETSPEYEAILNLLGDKVALMGWKKFKAGLDTRCTYPLLVFTYPIYYFKLLFLLISGLNLIPLSILIFNFN